MMVQMRPRVRRWFPSTMSWEPMFSRWTLCSFRNCRALSTFSRQWILIRPLVGLGWNKNTSQFIYKRQKPGTVNGFLLPDERGEEEEENSCGHSWTPSEPALCYDSVLNRVKVFSYVGFIITMSLIKRSARYKHPKNRKHVFISSEKQPPVFSTEITADRKGSDGSKKTGRVINLLCILILRDEMNLMTEVWRTGPNSCVCCFWIWFTWD